MTAEDMSGRLLEAVELASAAAASASEAAHAAISAAQAATLAASEAQRVVRLLTRAVAGAFAVGVLCGVIIGAALFG